MSSILTSGFRQPYVQIARFGAGGLLRFALAMIGLLTISLAAAPSAEADACNANETTRSACDTVNGVVNEITEGYLYCYNQTEPDNWVEECV